ncbi:MAG: hypothetical protein AB8B99_12500 [Phormidesmis sp.]
MTVFRFASHALAAITVTALATPALAQSNVSDITGPNVSDITGPNTSDITGTNVADDSSQRAAAAGFNQDSVRQLADDLGATYTICSGGGDCSVFFELYEQSTTILGQ